MRMIVEVKVLCDLIPCILIPCILICNNVVSTLPVRLCGSIV
jgi:hypothetical protein